MSGQSKRFYLMVINKRYKRFWDAAVTSLHQDFERWHAYREGAGSSDDDINSELTNWLAEQPVAAALMGFISDPDVIQTLSLAEIGEFIKFAESISGFKESMFCILDREDKRPDAAAFIKKMDAAYLPVLQRRAL